jgi:hypothetical protein
MNLVARVIGTVGGVVGAVALGGVTAQRMAVKRYHKPAADAGQDTYDSIDADRTYSVVAVDGAALHVEEVGPADAPLTVVFVHGWAPGTTSAAG